MAEQEDEALLRSLDLGSARGGRKRSREPLLVEIVRPLGEADLPLLLEPPAQGAAFKAPKALRYRHHQMARLLAAGKTSQEVAIRSGYSEAFISSMQRHDPSFRQLVSYYLANEEAIFADVEERMKALGLTAIEELQERLEAEPEGWTKQQLMDLAELMAVKPSLARSAVGVRIGVGPDGRVQSAASGGVEIRFVSPQEQAPSPGAVIEHEEIREAEEVK